MGAWRVTSQSDALGEKSLRIDPAPEELGVFLKRLLIKEEWRLGTECWRGDTEVVIPKKVSEIGQVALALEIQDTWILCLHSGCAPPKFVCTHLEKL